MRVARAFTVDDTALVSSNVAETETAWTAGSYSIGDIRRRTVDGVHRRFKSLVNTNTADPADGDATKWEDEGPTNRWAMFDQRLQAQTSNADSIDVQLQIVGRIDCVYVGNVSGQTLRIKATDASEGVVYDQTYSLVSASGITDWWTWFMEPIVGLRDLGRMDLPAGYSDLLLQVTISAPGATALCGELVTGLTRDLGGTRWGGGLGNKSYSTIGEDTFGDDFLIKRGKKRTGDFDVIVDTRHLDEVTTLLDDLDATAVLFVAHEDYAAMFIFGVLLSWKEVVSFKNQTALNVSLQSFTRT
ncbi:MAG: hypothetical protein JF588_11505 [Caulobacterales bacterium]|nr:hypothetical protein [Caulobacterales bacterium]